MSNEFNIANVKKGIGQSFEISVELNGISSTDWYIVPSGINAVSVTVTPSDSASCTVQTTTDSIEDIENENQITGIDWDAGSVTSATSDITAGRINAIRCVQTTTGKTKFTANC